MLQVASSTMPPAISTILTWLLPVRLEPVHRSLICLFTPFLASWHGRSNGSAVQAIFRYVSEHVARPTRKDAHVWCDRSFQR